uniref:Uncharacterized protein n=1 Tax=Arundo donax TaxID=35708 RepID=A0A0A8ZNU9_ARUDO
MTNFDGSTFTGQDYLSGNSACRWYFNPAILETEAPFGSQEKHRKIKGIEFLWFHSL